MNFPGGSQSRCKFASQFSQNAKELKKAVMFPKSEGCCNVLLQEKLAQVPVFYIIGVSVYSGCHKNIPQTGCLKQQKFTFSKFLGLEVIHQGAGKFSLWWELSFWLVNSCLLCIHLAVSLCVLSERELCYLFLFL